MARGPAANRYPELDRALAIGADQVTGSARVALIRLCAAGFVAYCSYAICRTPLLPLFARELGAGPAHARTAAATVFGRSHSCNTRRTRPRTNGSRRRAQSRDLIRTDRKRAIELRSTRFAAGPRAIEGSYGARRRRRDGARFEAGLLRGLASARGPAKRVDCSNDRYSESKNVIPCERSASSSACCELEPLDHGANGRRFGCAKAVILQIEIVNDGRKARDRRLVDAEHGTERLERAVLGLMAELHTEHVERDRVHGSACDRRQIQTVPDHR